MGTFTAIPVTLKELLDRVETGRIQLPDFQRGWVWDDDRIKSLLVSISRGFPVGAVMTLDAGGDIRFRSRLVEGAGSPEGVLPEQYLLDGQQRLTSLYQAMRHAGPVETRDRPGGSKVKSRWYYVDIQRALDPQADRDDTIISVPEDRIVRSNFGRTVELDLSSREHEFRQHMIPTEQVMNGMAWGFGYAQHWQQRGGHPDGDPFAFFERFKEHVLNSFTEYALPVINLVKGTPKEAVCTVFEKVNMGGVTLSVFELVTASFAAGDFSLRDDWEARRRRLHSEFGVLQGRGRRLRPRRLRAHPRDAGQFHRRAPAVSADPQQRRLQGPVRVADEVRRRRLEKRRAAVSRHLARRRHRHSPRVPRRLVPGRRPADTPRAA